MVFSPIFLVLLVLYVVMLAIGITKQEFRGSGFWFQALVGAAVVLTFAR